MPAMLTGFALAFARAVGEYGSVIFYRRQPAERVEIAPLLNRDPVVEFRYADATAIAVVIAGRRVPDHLRRQPHPALGANPHPGALGLTADESNQTATMSGTGEPAPSLG